MSNDKTDTQEDAGQKQTASNPKVDCMANKDLKREPYKVKDDAEWACYIEKPRWQGTV